jgi:hypothetical protein
MIIEKPTAIENKKKITKRKKLTLINIIKRYFLNILKRSQQSYLITKNNEK